LPWNITTPGLLFERLRDEYPAEPQVRSVMQADLSQEGAGPTTGFELRTGPQQMVFGAQEGSRLLIVGAEDVSVHGLPPYEGWESLEARLFSAVARIKDLIPDGTEVEQIGLRYINRIEIPKPSITFHEYLTIGFTLPPGFPQSMIAFLDRVEVVYPDELARLAFTWASTEAPEGASAFILDLDLNATAGMPIPIEEAREVLREMKRRETEAFEGLLQDSLREMFREIRA
jgi:uncharacterized protein (TIGR04255 family)